MEQHQVSIKMLGDFIITCGDSTLKSEDISNRLCSLLAFVLINKNPTTESLIEALWPDGAQNPASALKNLVYRTRQLLEKNNFPYAKNLILSTSNGYKINPDIDISIDALEMEKAFSHTHQQQDIDKKIEFYKQGVSFYKGYFLQNLPGLDWAIPLSQHYHTKYCQSVYDLLKLYKDKNDIQNLLDLARHMANIDKYEETAHKYIMYALYKKGESSKALAHYSYVTGIFYSELGVELSDGMQKLYNDISKKSKVVEVEIGNLVNEIRASDEDADGAFLCDLPVFKQICNFSARMSVRSGTSYYIGLITLGMEKETKEVKDKAILYLKEAVRRSLRKGDAYAYCSPTQYAVMLTMINIENANVVLQRIEKKFYNLSGNKKTTIMCNLHPIDAPFWE